MFAERLHYPTTATVAATSTEIALSSPTFDFDPEKGPVAQNGLVIVPPGRRVLDVSLSLSDNVYVPQDAAYYPGVWLTVWGSSSGERAKTSTSPGVVPNALSWLSAPNQGNATTVTDFSIVAQWNLADDLFFGRAAFHVSDVRISTRFAVVTLLWESGAMIRSASATRATLDVWVHG